MAKGLGAFSEGYGAASAIAKASAKPQRMQARRNKRVGVRATNKAYGALDRTFNDIQNDAARGFRQAGLGLSQGAAGLSSLMNVSGGAEGMVGAGAFGDIVGSGLRGLAQHKQADLQNMSRYRTQGALERKETVLNLVDEFRQEMAQIAAGQAATAASLAPSLQGQLWDREQQMWEREQAEAELARLEEERQQEQEYAQWLAKFLRNQLSGNTPQALAGTGYAGLTAPARSVIQGAPIDPWAMAGGR